MIFFMGGPQLGEVEAGAVAKLFGARISVSSGGLACVALVGLIAALVPALRSVSHAEVLAAAKKNEENAAASAPAPAS